MAQGEHGRRDKVTIQQVGVLLLITLIIGVACWLALMWFQAVFLIRY